MFDLDLLLDTYTKGFEYSLYGFATICILFALYRWSRCVSHYIETGEIDDDSKSWFLGKHNWFRGHRHYYGNHPWVVGVDIFITFVISLILSAAWPVSTIVMSVVSYAMIRRHYVVKKETFINNLKGEQLG